MTDWGPSGTKLQDSSSLVPSVPPVPANPGKPRGIGEGQEPHRSHRPARVAIPAVTPCRIAAPAAARWERGVPGFLDRHDPGRLRCRAPRRYWSLSRSCLVRPRRRGSTVPSRRPRPLLPAPGLPGACLSRLLLIVLGPRSPAIPVRPTPKATGCVGIGEVARWAPGRACARL